MWRPSEPEREAINLVGDRQWELQHVRDLKTNWGEDYLVMKWYPRYDEGKVLDCHAMVWAQIRTHSITPGNYFVNSKEPYGYLRAQTIARLLSSRSGKSLSRIPDKPGASRRGSLTLAGTMFSSRRKPVRFFQPKAR